MRGFLKFIFRFRDGLFVVLPLAVITAFLSLGFAVGPVSDALQGRLNTPRTLHYPTALEFDLQENLYVIDDNSRRILSFTPSGKERWSLVGGKRTNGFYESDRVVARPEGGVLVYNALRDPIDGSLEAEEILSYNSSGSLEGTLVHSTSVKDQRERGHIGAFVVIGNSLRYLFQEHGRLLVRERPIAVGGSKDTNEHKIVFSAALPPNLDYVTGVLHLPEGLVMCERSGMVCVLAETGTVTEPRLALNKQMQKPWDIKAGADGSLYVLDVLGRSVWKAPALTSATLEQVFGQAEVLNSGRKKPTFASIAISASGTLGIVDKGNNAVFLQQADGKILVFEGSPKADFEQFTDLLWVVVGACSFVLVLWSTVGMLRRFLSTGISIVVKQVALLLPLVVISSAIGSVSIFQLVEDRYQKALQARLMFLATMGSQTVGGSLAAELGKASDLESSAYRKLEQQIHDLVNGSMNSWKQSVHAVVYKYWSDEFFSACSVPSLGVMYPFSGATRAHYATARGAQVQFTRYSGEYGAYLSALAPLKGLSGEVTGVLEVYLPDNSSGEMFSVYNDNLFRGSVYSVLLVLLLLITSDLLLFLTLGFFQRTSDSTREEDDIANLARESVTLSSRMINHLGRLKEIRDRNTRFVSPELTVYLGKESLAELESGDRFQQKVTLLVIKLRSFSSLTESMTPEETLSFVNSYLAVMGPVIRRHGGFIQHYRSEAILAIFPSQPSDAVKAGLEMSETFVGFNRERVATGGVAVAFGMGVHQQEVLIGVVGEPNRLAVNLLSDAFELVNQVEAATGTYHVEMAMTEPVWKAQAPGLRARASKLAESENLGIGMRLYGL